MSTLSFRAGSNMPNGDRAPHSGSDAMFNFRADPELSRHKKVAMRRIPCCCDCCMDQLEMDWDTKLTPEEQPRHAQKQKLQAVGHF